MFVWEYGLFNRVRISKFKQAMRCTYNIPSESIQANLGYYVASELRFFIWTELAERWDTGIESARVKGILLSCCLHSIYWQKLPFK
jgi:hypothetical protein